MKLVKIFAVCAVLFGLFLWGISAYIGPDSLKNCDTSPSSAKDCQKADAIVALSGGDTAARADEAIRLYKDGWADLIIFSGAAADKSGPSNARVMKQQALNAGIPSASIIIEEQSETTEENAAATKDIFIERGIKDAIIVTSAYHTRRAGLEFDRRTTGITVRTHIAKNDSGWDALWWMTPYGWTTAIAEAVRSLVLSTGGIDRG